MTSAEAAVLAWFTGNEPPVGMGEHKTDDLIKALVVVWPRWMFKIHNVTNTIIDDHYKAMKSVESADMHMSREQLFESLAFRRSLSRIKADIAKFKNYDKVQIRDRIRQVVGRERYYSRLRVDALAKRIDGIAEYTNLRIADPRSDYAGGALWVLDPTKETHTDDCLAMAGRVWSWATLRLVNPANRHPGCGCHLKKDPSLTHGVSKQAAPIGVLPPMVVPSWDMGALMPRPMTDVKFAAPNFHDLHRSTF